MSLIKATTGKPGFSNVSDSNDNGRDSGMLDTEITHLLNSDTDDEDFIGFVDHEEK